MKRIKEVLLTQYIGAITIGFLLAQGIGSLISLLLQPVAWYLGRHSYFGGTEQAYPWTSAFLPSLAAVLLYFLVVYAFLRWLYWRPSEPAGLKAEPRQLGEQSDDIR